MFFQTDRTTIMAEWLLWLALLYLAHFIYRGVSVRLRFYRLRSKGMVSYYRFMLPRTDPSLAK